MGSSLEKGFHDRLNIGFSNILFQLWLKLLNFTEKVEERLS